MSLCCQASALGSATTSGLSRARRYQSLPKRTTVSLHSASVTLFERNSRTPGVAPTVTLNLFPGPWLACAPGGVICDAIKIMLC